MAINLHAPSRRELLLASGALFAWAYLPKIARAEGRDPRFLTIVLRGALDGLAAVAPVGDPDWVRLRGDKALLLDGANPALKLDGFFALNPAMPELHRLYRAGQATIVHAAATPYRERSHFDGQDVLESGLTKPGVTETGWLNRALASLEPGGRVEANKRQAFAVGPVTPLIVRGSAPVMSWTPARLPPAIAKAGGVSMAPEKGKPAQQGPGAQVRVYFAEAAGAAAKFMARGDGPRV